MRLLFAVLMLTLSFGSAQAALNTESLPAGPVVVVGLDLTALRATKVGQALEKLASTKAKDLEASRRLDEQLGIDSKKDLHGLVLGIYPGPDGKVAEKTASGVVLIRGQFQPGRINAFGQTHNIPSQAVGRHLAWEASPFIEKLTGEKPEDKKAYVVAHSEDLLVIAGAEFLERALAAADRNEKSAHFPAPVAAKFAAASNGWLTLYADATKVKNKDKEVGVEELALVLGENPTDLQLAIAAVFVSAEKAAQASQQLKGLQLLAAMGLAKEDGKSPDEKESMAMLAEMAQSIRIGGEDKLVTLELDYPAEKLAKAISDAAEKAQRTKGTPAAR
ncbi:MAG: hypothetical protein ACO3HN_03325 [Opitutales bacterium]